MKPTCGKTNTPHDRATLEADSAEQAKAPTNPELARGSHAPSSTSGPKPCRTETGPQGPAGVDQTASRQLEELLRQMADVATGLDREDLVARLGAT